MEVIRATVCWRACLRVFLFLQDCERVLVFFTCVPLFICVCVYMVFIWVLNACVCINVYVVSMAGVCVCVCARVLWSLSQHYPASSSGSDGGGSGLI